MLTDGIASGKVEKGVMPNGVPRCCDLASPLRIAGRLLWSASVGPCGVVPDIGGSRVSPATAGRWYETLLSSSGNCVLDGSVADAGTPAKKEEPSVPALV